MNQLKLSNAAKQKRFRDKQLRELRFAVLLQRLYEIDYSADELKLISVFMSTLRK